MHNKNYLLALNRIKGMGPRTIAKLLVRWPDLREIFSLSLDDMQSAGLSNAMATAISTFNMHDIEADLRWEEGHKNFLITWCDLKYPALLQEIHDAPPVLYAVGDLSCLDQPCIAMVGTRKPSVIGRDTARRFARELSAKNITIISGLALGIDAQSHYGCLDMNAKTVAVMGTGIDLIYPTKHAELASKISEQGLLLSELPLKSPPVAGHFPRRNRIISGLSSITLVVEAACRSGSLITARLALEQNRDVLAIPGSIYNTQAGGCNYLIQQGAKLVSSTQDVLDEFGIYLDVLATKELEERVALPVDVDLKLIKFMGFELCTVDEIIVRSGLDITEVICSLAQLELCGMIKSVAGGYMRCMV